MKRVSDYLAFASNFVGLGYLALWLLAGGGRLLGAACGKPGAALAPMLCGLPQAAALPAGMHFLGVSALILMALRLSGQFLRRMRAGNVSATATPSTRAPATRKRFSRKMPQRTPRPVKPRDHFGLRGTPH